jgi:hypothetical protein
MSILENTVQFKNLECEGTDRVKKGMTSLNGIIKRRPMTFKGYLRQVGTLNDLINDPSLFDGVFDPDWMRAEYLKKIEGIKEEDIEIGMKRCQVFVEKLDILETVNDFPINMVIVSDLIKDPTVINNESEPTILGIPVLSGKCDVVQHYNSKIGESIRNGSKHQKNFELLSSYTPNTIKGSGNFIGKDGSYYGKDAYFFKKGIHTMKLLNEYSSEFKTKDDKDFTKVNKDGLHVISTEMCELAHAHLSNIRKDMPVGNRAYFKVRKMKGSNWSDLSEIHDLDTSDENMVENLKKEPQQLVISFEITFSLIDSHEN